MLLDDASSDVVYNDDVHTDLHVLSDNVASPSAVSDPGNAHVDIDNAEDSDGEHSDSDLEDQSHEEPVLRRTGRNRRVPDRYQAGYNSILSKSGDWKEKCEFLVSCMREFPAQQTVFANAIAKIM